MKEYHDLVKNILSNGNHRGDRTGTGTISLFGPQIKVDLEKGFPLLTTKKMAWNAIVVELLWFLRGDTNIKYLLENGVHIWTADAFRVYQRDYRHATDYDTFCPDHDSFERMILANPSFAKKWGDLGPVYGAQWRQWPDGYDIHEYPMYVDQIKNVIESISTNPEGRRHIVTAWNPAEVDSMALPPCHCLFQFYVDGGRLSCHMYQRSADVFLGVPFNIASYALLTHIIAHQTGLGVGKLIVSFGDAHIYTNHIDQVREQLTREHRPLPTLQIDTQYQATFDPSDYHPLDFILEGYDPHPPIKGELSVGV